jgi:broad specificity phosphatase PhoE
MAKVMEDRRKLGAFYYRFPTGESGADGNSIFDDKLVCERVATFIDSLHRNFKEKKKAKNAILVTHGLTCRLFLMKWFHWDVDVFHNLYNFDSFFFSN